MRNKTALVLLLLIALPAKAWAEQAVRAIDGITLELANGQHVALAGIIAPRDATSLAKLAVGPELTIGKGKADRYGRLVANVTLPDGRDVATVLLEAGAAQIFPPTLRGKPVWKLEEAARSQQLGLWQQPDTRLLQADEADKFTNSWRVVEGKVASVASFGSTTYLNFGPDYKTDFTLTLPTKLAEKLQVTSWTGKVVRARGWVGWRNGAEIEIGSASQLEAPQQEPTQ